MNEAEVLDFAQDAIFTTLKVASPIMLVGLVVGLAIALFQALTSIQEMTLTFVPKILVVFASLLVLMPFMFGIMQRFMETIATRIVGIG
ncbi:MAG: flagellar biosynthesis protein FliQ [Alphaproteobacteria bacterium]|nr:flagellar biosynthesis protein FliQ [Alphaproteobacteria bacterium]